MSETQINIQSEQVAIEFAQEQVAIEFVQEEVQIEFVQEQTQIDFVSGNVVLNLTGVPGPPGANGVGIPSGGTTGQVLAKIDGDDYNTEWVDQSGGGGGGASITEITYADMETALQNATLTPGQFYNITDANGTDLGFICQAVKENEITVNGTGGYLNADFQAVGDYSNVEAGTGVAVGTQLGIWRPGFEAIVIPYTNISGGSFAVGDTITGGNTGATAVVDSDNGSQVTAYMTSAGVAFDGSEVLDNGNGVTADMDGAAGNPDIALGDVVIWNLLHYQLTDDTLLSGTDPETNTDAYTILDKATYPETYVEEWDVSEFDFPNNWLQYRADSFDNKIQYIYLLDADDLGLGYSGLLDFQWGNPLHLNNRSNGGYINVKNILCQLFYNVLYAGAKIHESTFAEGVQIGYTYMLPNATIANINAGLNTQILNNIIENGGSLTGITAGANCSISRNKIGQGATLGGDTTMGDGAKFEDNELKQNATIGNNTLGQYATVTGNRCESNSSLYGNTLGKFGSIYNNILQSGGEITNLTLLGDPLSSSTEFSENTIGVNIHVSEKTLEIGVKIKGNVFSVDSDETEPFSENIEGKRAIPSFSDITGTIDITGLTTLDITAAWAQYRGVINLTSDNATESIDTITNPPTLFPFTLRPAAGLALTITGTAYAGIWAGQIALKATDYVLDGDKGEYIVLEIDPLGSGCLVEKYVVNGLI